MMDDFWYFFLSEVKQTIGLLFCFQNLFIANPNKDILFLMAYFFQATKKWRVYDDEDFRLLDKYYVYDKLFDVDVRFRSLDGKVRIEEGFKRKSNNELESISQVNFEIPIGKGDKSFYSSLTQDGFALFAYDNGMTKLSDSAKINFFSSFQTSRNFRDQIYKIGFRCIGDSFNYGLRLKLFNSVNRSNAMNVYAKGSQHGDWSHGRWWFDFNSIYKPYFSKFIQNGVLLGFTYKDWGRDTFNIRIQSGQRNQHGMKGKDFLNEVKLNWRRRLEHGTRVGFQTKLSPNRRNESEDFWNHTWIGGSWRLPEQRVIAKAKINPNLTWAVAINHSLGSFGSYSVGMEMKDMGRKNTMRFGAKIWIDL